MVGRTASGRPGVTWDPHTLFRRHSKELVRFLRRRGLSAETAADLAQDTFVRLLTAQPQGSGSPSNPKAYLFQISRNLSLDFLRRQRLVPMVDIADDALAAIADPMPSPETQVYDRQRLALSAAALAELPERTRRAFEMHRLGDMTLAETGRRLGLSTTQTWALIRDAYLHIHARLHDTCE
jgi:RNA polymerase sigma-70 factor (ECF subfamily)